MKTGCVSSQVAQPVAHAWVDGAQRVQSERLRWWTAAEATWSPLATVVQEALDALANHDNLALPSPNHHATAHATHATHANHARAQPPSSSGGVTFAEVDALSNDQLREVLSSDSAFDAVLDKVVQRSLSLSHTHLQRLRQQNADIAGRLEAQAQGSCS
jgi:hypothetical protein